MRIWYFIHISNTVDSEILARVYFRETSRRSFVKIKPSRNGKITLAFTDVGNSCPKREFLTWQICRLTQFAKISESTVCVVIV